MRTPNFIDSIIAHQQSAVNEFNCVENRVSDIYAQEINENPSRSTCQCDF